MKKKTIIALVAVVLAVAVAVGTTLAWLTTSTEELENTFTFGNIDITLTESEELDLKIIPGKEITKDPVVTVIGGSEACWLFVTVEESDNFGTFMTYEIAEGWTELEAGVYYRSVDASDADQAFGILANDTVTVLDTVTKDDVDGADAPTLTFVAYAVQAEGFGSAAAAWAVAE